MYKLSFNIIFLNMLIAPIILFGCAANNITTSQESPTLESTQFPASPTTTVEVNYLCNTTPKPELIRPLDDTVYLSGRFFLCTLDDVQSSFDFDQGESGKTNMLGADINLIATAASVDNRSLYFLQEINGAFVNTSETSMPTQDYCNMQVKDANRLTLILASDGAYGCALTNEGRVVSFQVVKINPIGLESVEVLFTTWNNK